MARLTPTTRDALTDEGLSALVGREADHASVDLDAFMVPTRRWWSTPTSTCRCRRPRPSGSPVTIVRRGTLTFVNDNGTWKIDAFDLTVERDVP